MSDVEEKGSNVVLFPIEKVTGSPPLNLDEIKQKMLAVREVAVYETLELLTDRLFHQIFVAGFDFTSDPDYYAKEIALLVESLSSLLKKHAGIGHRLQAYADEVFDTQGMGRTVWKDTGELSTYGIDEDGDVIEEEPDLSS